MKFVRFASGSNSYQGVLQGDEIHTISGDIYKDWQYAGGTFPLDGVTLLAPLVPNHIIGIGANYVSKLEDKPAVLPELPAFFFKPVSSVTGPDEKILIPAPVQEVKFESELAVVIGRETKNVAVADVPDYIFGYTVGNDVTAPQFFHEDGHWMIGKSFDTFTPLGPVIETELAPLNISVKARLNGTEQQNSPTTFMIVSLSEMIAFLSTVMTLKAGDVILTGSPPGAGYASDSDRIECEIEEIGILRNTFVQDSDSGNVRD